MRQTSRQLAEAFEIERSGRLPEAISAYRRILAREPRNSDALHLLGVAMSRMGQPQDAVAILGAALEIQPLNSSMHANLGTALSALGRFDEAVGSFERALTLRPDFAAAHRGRGAALLRLGRLQEAHAGLSRALQLAPQDTRILTDFGVVMERLGQTDEALRCFERALLLNPDNADALHNRGLLQASLNKPDEALRSLDRAAALQPRHAAIHANRGSVLCDLNRLPEGIASFDKALSLAPDDGVTQRKRARALMLMQRYAEALVDYDAILARQADDFEVHCQRGLALAALERHDDSLASYDAALALNPQSAEALNNRGVALQHLDRAPEALESFLRALRYQPNDADAHSNAANSLKLQQRYPEALVEFERALALHPDNHKVRWSTALLKLTLGRFLEGWPLYESRLHLQQWRPLQRHADLPRWTGESIPGKTLLVHAEQGLGDTLQFCRYIPLLEARDINVVFEVQPTVETLLRSLKMRGTLRSFDQTLPSFDVSVPLLSLPLMMGTDLLSIPGETPYLQAETAASNRWRQQLAGWPGIKVGLNWQGDVETEKQADFRGRSFSLDAAASLAEVPGVTLISLQKGQASSQRARVNFADRVLELIDPFDFGPADFADTAALISSLDLVITSDTAVAHLSGALGVPVWVVLSTAADWRWLTDRDNTPWYKTMRLFRQRRFGAWHEVFSRVAARLTTFGSDS